MRDKVVIVVGATGGIGSTLAQTLAPLDANLVLASRDGDRLASLMSQLPGDAGRQIAVPTDITDPDSVTTLIQKTLSSFGRVDALVNAAGAGILKPYHKLDPADLQTMLDVNLKGSFYTCQAAAEVMKEQKSGHICNVVGILGKHPMATAAAYCAAKYGVVGFSKCMADELKRFAVKFTLFYFGGVDTPFWDNISLKVDRTKMLRPQTAASAILFALSTESQAIPLEVNLQPESHLFL
jgi:short-subunit dehydrogenase